MADSNLTRMTLLMRIADPDNNEAWLEFEKYYRRFIYYIISQFKVPAHDCDDLAQEVLVKLARNVHKYDRTRAGFRTWLGTICRNCVYSYFRKRSNRTDTKISLDELEEKGVTLGDEGQDALENMIELEWKNYITSLAIERVRPTFRGNAMKVFEMANKDISFAEIAEKLSMTEKSVSVINRRVYNKLIIEVKNLVFELEGRENA